MSEIRIQIESEIEPLRHVLVHRPGDEVVRMTQHELELMLFDDILSPPETVREHDVMVEILRGAGASSVDVADLLSDALERAPVAAREELLSRCCEQAGVSELAPILADWSAERLGRGLICGVYWNEVDDAPVSLARLRSELDDSGGLALRPTPNLMFMRDPCMCVGNYVVVGRMARAARAREPLLVAFAIRHSGRVHQPELLFEPDERNNSGGIGSLEGGDMLVLAPDVVLIGCSQRTTAQTIERVAHEALFPSCPELQRIYVVFMPERRSVMHLDTILTHVDRRVFLGHAPLVTPGDGALAVAQLDRASRVQLLEGASVLDALREAVGDDTQLVPCGGEESLHQEREQWTDGANALTLAPGRIILYARNAYTIAALTEHGFEEVRLHTAQPPQQRTQLITEGMQQGRAVFSFSGSELSRARGGGRCLTMPLARQPHFGCSV